MGRILKIGIILTIPLFWLCAPKTVKPIKTEVVPLYEKEEAQVSPEEIKVEPVKPEETKAPTAMVSGFRVQIGAFRNKEGAETLASEARTRFTEKVYVEYIYPFYKVRVGDCATRSEAEILKQKAISLGYLDAFITPTQIESR